MLVLKQFIFKGQNKNWGAAGSRVFLASDFVITNMFFPDLFEWLKNNDIQNKQANTLSPCPDIYWQERKKKKKLELSGVFWWMLSMYKG